MLLRRSIHITAATPTPARAAAAAIPTLVLDRGIGEASTRAASATTAAARREATKGRTPLMGAGV